MNLKETCESVLRAAENATPRPWKSVSDLPKYAIASGDTDVVTSQNRLYRVFEKHHGCEKQDVDYIVLSANSAEKMARALLGLIDTLDKTAKMLDSIKAELNAGVYTVSKDEFETVFIARDLAQEALSKAEEIFSG